MKLEVGESLSLSWLRHVRHCQVVQLNWKITPKALKDFKDDSNYEVLEHVLSAAKSELNSPPFGDSGSEVLKSDVDLDQLLRQGEVDALGLCLEHQRSGPTHAFAVEVAFHEDGLNYGTKSETATRVGKKMLRSAILLSGPLGLSSGDIIFATPKVGDAIRREIEPMVSHVRDFLSRQAASHQLPEFGFNFYGGDDFELKLLKPLLDVADEVTDTSELFIRSYQLLRLFKLFKDHV